MYDSKYGVTCHWCRQKTLEDHVTCTNSTCGKGKRLATTFWCVWEGDLAGWIWIVGGRAGGPPIDLSTDASLS